jgi:hypothetical protein
MLVLTDQELKDLTGTNVKAKQIENLKENGIPHTIGVDGRARVISSVLTQVLMCTTPGGLMKKKNKEPDFSKLNS